MKLHKLIFRARNFDNVLSTTFRKPRSTISSAPEPTRIMTLLYRPSAQLNKSLARLKIAFHETAQAQFRARNLTVLSTFCRRPRSKNSSASEPTRTMTLLHRPLIQLNKSVTRLKTTFQESAQTNFSSSNFDILSSFFEDNLDQKLPLLQNLIGL